MVTFFNKDNNIGKKAKSLVFLEANMKSDVLFADGIVLGKSAYVKVVEINKNIDSYEDIVIPTEICDFVYNNVKFDKNQKFVARSSASCEDSVLFSASGQYDSFMGIKSFDKMIEAIKKIYFSFITKSVMLYSKINNVNIDKEYMAILIQEQVPVEMTGVIFSRNPKNQKDECVIEIGYNNGVSVVSGMSCDKRVFVGVGDKTNDRVVSRLIDAVCEIKELFNKDVDVEWGFADNKLFIFQARPIIFNPKPRECKYSVPISAISCKTICSSYTIGKIKTLEELSNFAILCNGNLDVKHIPVIVKAGGIILQNEVLLSHLSNICREFDKPCVCVSKDKFDDDVYVIDSVEGKLFHLNDLDHDTKITFLQQYIKNFGLKFKRYKNIYAQMNLINSYNNNQYERVFFDQNNTEIKCKLVELGFSEKVLNQKLQTYDFADKALIDKNVGFRINCDEDNNRIQMKQVKSLKNSFRKEKETILVFASVIDCVSFMDNLGMKKTGEQERKINRFTNKERNIIVNFIQWPKGEEYFGIEAREKKDIKLLCKDLNLNDNESSSIDGVNIFNKLKLNLKECKFGGKDEK